MNESGQKFRFSKALVSKVKAVQFSSMSEEEIKNWTVLKVQDQTQEDRMAGPSDLTGNNQLNDMKLGISSASQKCKLCNQDRECPGHFGHIELYSPIFHIGYINTVVKILKCVCTNCGRLKYQNSPEYKSLIKSVKKRKKTDHESQDTIKKRLRKLSKLLVGITKCCGEEAQEDDTNRNKDDEVIQVQDDGRCNNEDLPRKLGVKENHKIFYTDAQDSEKYFTAQEVFQIFKKIEDNPEDLRILGFNADTKPCDLLIKRLLIPPPQVRPSASFAPNKPASHDDLTRVYKNVLTLNDEIKRQNNEQERNLKINELTLAVGRMMDNCKNALKTMSIGKKNKKVKSLKERLKGKEGRFRQNLMGKRVDFSARSVISGDANLHMDQLGVPRAIAFELTVPQQVTHHNKKQILELAEDDRIKTILKPNKDKDREEYIAYQKIENKEKIAELINYGVIVERYLQDGDYVLFNRQPTLHKMSMMGHRVKVLPGSTFRINLSVTTPYNADFDGDEMNMHVPQSTESQSELKNLCHVPKQIVVPKSNQPVMGIVQDSLLGSCLFTLRDNFLTKAQVMNLCCFIMDWDGKLPMPTILRPEPLWTGKQMMSMIIPKSIQIQRLGNDPVDQFNSQDDTTILVYNGQLLQGVMNKSVIGDGPGGLVHTVWLDESPQKCMEFMTQAQRIVNNWLTTSGFTISCSDMVPLQSCDDEVKKVLDESQEKWEKSYIKFQNREIIAEQNLLKPGQSIFTAFEFEVNNILNDQRQKANSAATKEIPFRYNNFKRMVWSGSKGKETNLAQVLGVVGQQNVDGQRPYFGFNRRTLPHFQRDTHGLSERGFVKANFFRGLLPYEFFFHTMGGREGLSDTAVKTATTGYIQRKLVKAIEDVKVCYDGTVRESSGTIIETSYGEDCLAGEYIEKQTYLKRIVSLNNNKFSKQYEWPSKLNHEQKQILTSKVINEIENEEINELKEEYEQLIQDRSLLRKCFATPKSIQDVYLPVSIDRIIKEVKPQQGGDLEENAQEKVDLSPVKVVRKVQELFKYLDALFQKRSIVENLTLFKAHVRFSIASKEIILEHKFNSESLDNLLRSIQYKFCKSIVHSGECVGSIAAQSIGEPTTQMTLNTFHHAGASDRNVTLGVPRLKEILDASKNIKTPQMTIYFHPREQMLYKGKKKNANEMTEGIGKQERQKKLKGLKDKICVTKLKDYIAKTEIYYDPDPKNSIFQIEQDEYDMLDDTDQLEPWVLVIYAKDLLKKKELMKQLQSYPDLKDTQIEDISSNFLKDAISIRIKIQGEQDDDRELDQLKEYNEKEEYQVKDKADQEYFSNYQYLRLIEKKITGHYLINEGVKGIVKVLNESSTYENWHLTKDEEIQDDEVYKEDYIVTDGSNLKEILQLDEVDATRTFSNDVMEIARILGIEAARIQAINEMNAVFGKYSIYVNYRHMKILIDWMTHRGTFIPCTRNGVNRIPNVSCLRKASFEETVEMLYDAAIYAELDQMRGVSENIVFGQKCDLGTNIFDLYINYDKVGEPELVPKNQDLEEQEELVNYDETTQDTEIGSKTPMYPQTPHVLQTPNLSMNTPFYNQGSFTPVAGAQGSMSVRSQAFSPTYMPQNSVRSTISPSYNSTYSPAYKPNFQSNSSPSGSGSESQTSPNMSGTSSPYYSPGGSHNNYQNSPSSPAYQGSINSPQNSSYTNSNNYGSDRQQAVYSPSSPGYNTGSGYKSPLQSQRSSGIGSGQDNSLRSQSPSYNNNASPVYKYSSSYQQQSTSPQQISSINSPSGNNIQSGEGTGTGTYNNNQEIANDDSASMGEEEEVDEDN